MEAVDPLLERVKPLFDLSRFEYLKPTDARYAEFDEEVLRDGCSSCN
ncbi:hypothetical protein [Haladaptatus sp. DYF46]|nr:hypothetical protein [Haladaptatus sp. DYF46]